jgi:hypothetical protein
MTWAGVGRHDRKRASVAMVCGARSKAVTIAVTGTTGSAAAPVS